MMIDHVAIWTTQLERLKDYYIKYFHCCANEKYLNNDKHFESYFVSFDSGARLELMQMPGIPENLNDPVVKQYLGIIHLSFGMESMDLVNDKFIELKKDGFRILRKPVTGIGNLKRSIRIITGLKYQLFSKVKNPITTEFAKSFCPPSPLKGG
jgi:lactoylglutathione lyase